MSIVFKGRVFTVMAKYVLSRKGLHYYQRRIPRDVAHHYPSDQRTKIVKPLGRMNLAAAAREAAKCALEDDNLWAAYRGGKSKGEREVRSAATALLKKYGLKPEDQHRAGVDRNVDALISAFLEAEIEPEREVHASQDEQTYYEAQPEEYLTPVKLEAQKQLHGEIQFLASDALELYLSLHDRRNDPKFLANVTLAFDGLRECVGDLPIQSYRREHANRFREWMMDRGCRTSTVRRRLGVLRAAFNSGIRERELSISNVFQKIRIPNLGADAQQRRSFTNRELVAIAKTCRERDDDLRWIVALVADTGARLGEIVGLRIEDIHLEGKVPFIEIVSNEARRIKTAASTRKVPLVGEALWAAKRVLESAQAGQKYAFPRYTSDGVCKADSASAAVGMWLRKIGIGKSAHSFRHTIRDRLRNVDAPKEIQDAVGGWGRQEIGQQYGEGYAVAQLARWLHKVA